jgi:hypothetical protein
MAIPRPTRPLAQSFFAVSFVASLLSGAASRIDSAVVTAFLVDPAASIPKGALRAFAFRSGTLVTRGWQRHPLKMADMTTRTKEAPTDREAPISPQARQTWLAVGLIILGAGAAAVSLLGPLSADLIHYHASEGAVNQILGGDVSGLVLVASVSILAGILVWRGHPAGPVLALGLALYALYMYSQLALGGDVARYPGNSERVLLYLGLFVLAGAITLRAWAATDRSACRRPPVGWTARSASSS